MKKHFVRTVSYVIATVLLALPVCAQQAAPARDTSPQILDVQGGKIRVVAPAGFTAPVGSRLDASFDSAAARLYDPATKRVLAANGNA